MNIITVIIWNEANIAHIAKHNVTKEEVEEVIYSANYAVRETYLSRLALIGPTGKGRMLHIVVFPQTPETYYVVTARDADRQEQTIYQQDIEKGGEKAA